jgi:hypothetical protein
MLKRLANDKHSSLIRSSVNYGSKKFYSTGPWNNVIFTVNIRGMCCKIFYGRNQFSAVVS